MIHRPRMRALREGLWPWPLYAAVTVAQVVLLPLLLTGTGFQRPEAARHVGLVGIPLALIGATLTVIAYRHQRRR